MMMDLSPPPLVTLVISQLILLSSVQEIPDGRGRVGYSRFVHQAM